MKLRFGLGILLGWVVFFFGMDIRKVESAALVPGGEGTPPVFTPAECPFENESLYQVDCGYLTVPEDHANPDGPQIQLAVAVVRSPNPDKEPDPVLFLQGGPGGELLSVASYYLNRGNLAAMLLQRDVILVDQRGIGYSRPAVNCEVFHTPKEILDLSPQEITLRLNECPAELASRGIHWQFYTTDQNAADLAMVGPALGYTKVNLFGVSYGTLLGLLILRDHPELVRSAVLDSVMVPGFSSYEQSAQWSEYSFQKLEEDCRADWNCRLAYPDLRRQMIETYDRLKARPGEIVVNGETVTITASFFAHQSAWVGGNMESMPAFITAIAHEDYEAARPFIQGVLKAKESEMPNLAIFETMSCPYQAGSTSPERIVAAFAPYAEPFQVSRFTVEDWKRCASWNPEPPASFDLPHNDIPVLLLAGAYDAATPSAWARYAALGLSRAQVFEVPHTGHSVTSAGGETEKCTTGLVSAFYQSPTDRLDASCLAKIPGPAFILHTTVTRFPIQAALFPLALLAVGGLGWAGVVWRRHPRWTAWRAAFRQLGLMPWVVLGLVVGLSLFGTVVADEDAGGSIGNWLRAGVVTTIVPLFMAIQATMLFSPEEEPALEITLAAPRPIAWLIVERLAAAGLIYAAMAGIGTAIVLLRSVTGFSLYILTTMALGWVAPALFLSGLGLYLAARTRMPAFGAAVVLAIWLIFGLFARFLLPGMPAVFPLNLIQPFLWAIHLHLTPQDLPPADFWLNRFFLSCAGLSLIGLAVRSMRDSEVILLNSRRAKKSRMKAQENLSAVPSRGGFVPVAVQPQALIQIGGLAWYEFLLLWRQRLLRIFTLTPIALFAVMVAINILDRMIDPAALAYLPRDQVVMIYGEFLAWINMAFVMGLVLWIYPLLVAPQVPTDLRLGVSEWQKALPLSEGAYLMGKILGAVLAGSSALILVLGADALIWFLRVGVFNPLPLLNLLGAGLLLLLLTTALGLSLGATQPGTLRAMAFVLVVLVVPEFMAGLPGVKLVFPVMLDFMGVSSDLSYAAMTARPVLVRGFDPLGGGLGLVYAGLAVKTAVVVLAVWAWRRFKK